MKTSRIAAWVVAGCLAAGGAAFAAERIGEGGIMDAIANATKAEHEYMAEAAELQAKNARQSAARYRQLATIYDKAAEGFDQMAKEHHEAATTARE